MIPQPTSCILKERCGQIDSLMPDTDSDGTLLRRFRDGEDEAATALYKKYVNRIRFVAEGKVSGDLGARVDSDDIVQSVFRTFFRRVAAGQYLAPAGEELWKLLVVITLNKVRSTGEYHRAAKRDIRHTNSGETWINNVPDGENGQIQVTELRLLVEELIGQLPAVQRTMVQLRLEGYEFAEIADQCQRSKRTVERVLHDFRQVLEIKLREDWKE
jgi:RNA polymerase sigma factor (sigma-70 family)